MAKPKTGKPNIKVADLPPRKNPKGGERDPASGLPTGKRMHEPLLSSQSTK